MVESELPVTGQLLGAVPCNLSTVPFETNILGNISHARGSRLFEATDFPQHGGGTATGQLSAQRMDLGYHRGTYAEALRSSL